MQVCPQRGSGKELMSIPRAGRVKGSGGGWAVIVACVLLVHLANRTAVAAILPIHTQALAGQMDKPFKLDIRILSLPPRMDDRASVEVSLRNAANERVSWSRQCSIEIEVTAPSGKKEKYVVNIRPGQSAVEFTFYIREPGLFLLRAHETSNFLLPTGNSVLVRTRNGKTGAKLNIRKAVLASSPHLSADRDGGSARPPLLAAGNPEKSRVPHLLFLNSTGREILADGKDFARLQVHLMDPDGKRALSDIQIWLSWSHGELNPQPLVIRRGESSSEAQIISRFPGEAVISLVGSSPAYSVDGQREIRVSFGTPIYGIKVSSPNPLALSLIDCQPLLAQFFDEQGRTVQTSKPRRITFSSSTPDLRLEPASRDVPVNEAGASVFIFPGWRGRATLNVFTPGYEPQILTVDVTIWAVLVLCLCGGIGGGIAARGALNASLLWRGFVGVLGAAVFVGLFIYAVLPQTRSMVVHNQISAFVVSVIGGCVSTRVLHFVMNKIGLPVAVDSTRQ